MPHLYLGLAIHNHQPVGNYPFVFEQVYRDAYLPLLEALERHPRIRLSLHYSGCLLDWLFANRPQFIERVAALAARGQVELMSGGYYEPILPIIPDADKIGQIQKLSRTVEEWIGQRPTGMWLAERVWEPHLPSSLAQAGVEWTVLDDTHFRLSGIAEAELKGYYLTEYQGYVIKVYSSSKRLRYLIPWRSVAEVIDYLRQQADDRPGTIVMWGDDGEKFGSWPGTFAYCWERGWMEDFLVALEENADWLTVTPLGEHAHRFPALGTAYFPTAAYDEMMEWALPAELSAELVRLRHEATAAGRDDILRHLGGGFWRNFFRKYPEINAMHKRILRAHHKVQAAGAVGDNGAAQDWLWRGECNDTYWHGIFGGLYLADIRAVTHANLIAAETEADRLLHGDGPWLAWQHGDVDLDGRDELLLQSGELSLCLHPDRGGMLSEWDVRRHRWNLLNVISRRREAYHEALLEQVARQASDGDVADSEVHTIHDQLRVKEAGIQRYLVFDAYRRGGLQEHILPPDADGDGFAAGRFADGDDFVHGEYVATVEETPETLAVQLTRDGWCDVGETRQPLRISKRLVVNKQSEKLDITYEIVNVADRPLRALFVSEWNLHLPYSAQTIGVDDGTEQRFHEAGELPPSSRIRIDGGPFALEAELAAPACVWRFPIETVTNSEGGLERSLQGVCLAFVLELALEPDQRQGWAMTWRAT